MPVAQPSTFAPGLELKPYQLKGDAQVDFLCRGPFRGCILADQMGLGKTVQAIAALELARGQPGMSLVVCPESLVSVWYQTFIKMYHLVRYFPRRFPTIQNPPTLT